MIVILFTTACLFDANGEPDSWLHLKIGIEHQLFYTDRSNWHEFGPKSSKASQSVVGVPLVGMPIIHKADFEGLAALRKPNKS